MEVKDNVLYAGENKLLTDGVIFGKVVYLADGVDAPIFYEVDEDLSKSEVIEF